MALCFAPLRHSVTICITRITKTIIGSSSVLTAFIIILATYSDYFPTDFEPVVFQNLDALFHCAAGTQYLQVLFICTEAVKLLNRNFKNEDWKLSIVSKCRHEYYLSRKI